MNERDLETAVLRALSQAAGQMGDRPIEPDRPLAEQFDLDPERFFQALSRETGIDIPVSDRSRMTSFTACMDYLAGGMEE
jgi:hypothetical protein